jgi:hypothetical protein
MIPVQSTQLPALEFSENESSKKILASSNRIGWLHSKSDNAGAKFDLMIKDSLGRVKMRKINCGNDTDQYGELINLETRLGEELEVVVENIKGAKKINVFVN